MPSTTLSGTPANAMQFDILTGPKRVEVAVKEMAAVRQKMSVSELGTLAGVGVLEQFRVAKAETSLAWLKNPTLAFGSLYELLAVILPVLSLIAGLAIDVAVFGTAADGLTEHGLAYYGFCLGALVFAAGIGIAKEYRTPLIAISMVACLGASLVVSDSHEFRDHFADALPWLISTKSTTAGDILAEQGVIDRLTEKEKLDTQRAQITAESRRWRTRGTSAQYSVAAASDEEKLNTELIKLGKLKAEQAAVADDVRVRLFSAIYIFCWLLASQLVVSAVIRKGPKIFRRRREAYNRYNVKRQFVKDLDGIRSERSKHVAIAAVGDMLMRFNNILTVSPMGGLQKSDAVASLFEEESLRRMTQIGVELVCLTLT